MDPEYDISSSCGINAMLRGVTADTAPIDFKTQLNYGDMTFNNCLMFLEPRLQEYVKKKEYYTKNKIKQDIPLEQDYRITQSDLINISKLLKCKDKPNCGLTQIPLTHRTTGRQKCGNVQVSRFVNNEGEKFKIQKRPVATSLESFGCVAKKEGFGCNTNSGCGMKKEGFDSLDNAGSVPNLTTIPCDNNKFVQTNMFASKYSPKNYTYFNYATDNNANYYQPTRTYMGDNFNRATQYIYKADPSHDWKQVSQQKPMKYRLNSIFSPNAIGKNEQQRNINQKEIDNDSFMRPSFVDMDLSGLSAQSYFDNCYKYVIPGGRNKQCYNKDEYLNHSFYLATPFMGFSKGNGDIDIESGMKQSQTTKFKEKVGPQLLDRFETLDRDVTAVEDFIRGGLDSRQIDKYAKRDAQYVI